MTLNIFLQKWRHLFYFITKNRKNYFCFRQQFFLKDLFVQYYLIWLSFDLNVLIKFFSYAFLKSLSSEFIWRKGKILKFQFPESSEFVPIRRPLKGEQRNTRRFSRLAVTRRNIWRRRSKESMKLQRTQEGKRIKTSHRW